MPSKPKNKKEKSPSTATRLSATIKDDIIDAALRLAAEQGWPLTTVRDIAGAAGTDLVGFYDVFDGKDDILSGYGQRLDRRVLTAFSDFHPETPVRDLIFDILMERFDLANMDKAGIRAIFDSFRLDPKQVAKSLPLLGASMTRMLEAAGVEAYGWKGALRIAGMTAITAWVTRIWLDDDSPDLSKTMAALDKALSKIGNLADRLGL